MALTMTTPDLYSTLQTSIPRQVRTLSYDRFNEHQSLHAMVFSGNLFSRRYHAERRVPKIELKDFRILEKIRLSGAKLKGTQVKRRLRSDAQKQNDIRRERERKQLSEEYTKGIYYSKEMSPWNSKSHTLKNGGNLE
ncbi:hypothetical protein TNCV_2908761 [Trichonephila clavipes]|nr:hypothetical protein TNCV_2908761 [Trichonephila clavipes]